MPVGGWWLNGKVIFRGVLSSAEKGKAEAIAEGFLVSKVLWGEEINGNYLKASTSLPKLISINV